MCRRGVLAMTSLLVRPRSTEKLVGVMASMSRNGAIVPRQALAKDVRPSLQTVQKFDQRLRPVAIATSSVSKMSVVFLAIEPDCLVVVLSRTC